MVSAINVPAGRLVSNAVVDGAPSASEVEHGGALLLNSATDDALGYASDPRVREAAFAAIRRQSLETPASGRLVAELQERLAAWLSVEACALLPHPGVLFDAVRPTHVDRRLVVREGYAGIPLADADELSAGDEPRRLWIEAAHPLEGDLAPLHRYVERASSPRTELFVLDPLGLGVLGATGGGVLDHFQVDRPDVVRLLFLGTALTTPTWVVAGPRELVDGLARLGPLTWPTASIAGATKALELCAQEPHRRVRLLDLAERLQGALAELGADTGPAVTQVVPLWLGEETLAQRWLTTLAEAGIAARAWLEPGRARLLLTPSATLSDAQLDRVIAGLAQCAKKCGLPELPQRSSAPAVARPGTFAVARACGPWWTQAPVVERPSASPRPPSPTAELRTRLGEAVEGLTWRVANTRIPNIKDVVDPALIRAVLDRVRRR